MHMGDRVVSKSINVFLCQYWHNTVYKKRSMQLICNSSLGVHKKLKSDEGEGKLWYTINIIFFCTVKR